MAEPNRRKFLTYVGIGAVVGVAGCNDSAGDSGDGEDETERRNGETAGVPDCEGTSEPDRCDTEPDSFKWASATVFEDLELARTRVSMFEDGSASE